MPSAIMAEEMRGKLLRRLLILVLGVAICGAGASWWVGDQLVRPVPHAVPLPPDFPVSAVSIPGHDRNVAAWWGDQGEDAPAVVLVHGIRGDRLTMVPRARVLLRHGFSVLLIDLQAHGETPGSAITLGWKEADDVRAALSWLKSRRPATRVGVIGCSLGGAAVVLGPQPSGFDAVVLEAVYPRIETAVEDRIRLRLGPLAPLLAPPLLVQLPAPQFPLLDGVRVPYELQGTHAPPEAATDARRHRRPHRATG